MMMYELSETGEVRQLTDISYVHICSCTYKPGSYSNDMSVCRSAVSSFLIHGNLVVMQCVSLLWAAWITVFQEFINAAAS